jgi:hypothetical protein
MLSGYWATNNAHADPSILSSRCTTQPSTLVGRHSVQYCQGGDQLMVVLARAVLRKQSVTSRLWIAMLPRMRVTGCYMVIVLTRGLVTRNSMWVGPGHVNMFRLSALNLKQLALWHG